MCNYVAYYQTWNTGSRWRSNVCWIQWKFLLCWWGCYSSYCMSCCWRSLNMHVTVLPLFKLLLTFFSVWRVELTSYSIFLFLFPAFSYVLGSEISTSLFHHLRLFTHVDLNHTYREVLNTYMKIFLGALAFYIVENYALSNSLFTGLLNWGRHKNVKRWEKPLLELANFTWFQLFMNSMDSSAISLELSFTLYCSIVEGY
jgi:hypothetical protein